MKNIIKSFILIFFVTSCEDSESDGTTVNPFLGTWYLNTFEEFAEFSVNTDQSAVPIGPNLVGYRAMEGGVSVSGSEINRIVRNGYPYNIYYIGTDFPIAVFTNYSYLDLASFDDPPSDFTMFQIVGDSAQVQVYSSDSTYSYYRGAIDLNWNIDPTDSTCLESIDQSGNLNYFSFNSPASLYQIDEYGHPTGSETVMVEGSLSFSSVDIAANTATDLYNLIYGMSLSDLMELMGDNEDMASEEITLTISDDNTYTIIFTEMEYDDYYEDTTGIIYSSDTCSGEWTINGDSLYIDPSTEICNDDDDYYYYEGDSSESQELIAFGINENGNIEVIDALQSGFCEVNFSVIGGGNYYGYDELSEEECTSAFEKEFALISGSAESIMTGFRMELSKTNPNSFLRSTIEFNNLMMKKLLSNIGGTIEKKWLFPARSF